MIDSQINDLEQGVSTDSTVQEELRKYEALYDKAVGENGMTLINQRGFQIALFSLLTFCILYIAYSGPYAPYSFIPALLLVGVQWYVFSLYDKLRLMLKSDTDGSDTLSYFRHRRDIMIVVSYMRRIAIVNGVLIIFNIWFNRSPEKFLNQGALALWIGIAFMMIALIIQYRLKVRTVVIYLDNLVKQLEEKQSI